MKMTKPNNCCISCKNIEDLFSLYDVHECSDIGDIEASANMLKECFNIEIIPASNFTSICGQCMLRLRDAHHFRKDIIKSIQELQKQLCLINSDAASTITPNAKYQNKENEELSSDPKSLNAKLAEKVDENINLNVLAHENSLFIELCPLEKKKSAYQDNENRYKIEPGQTDCTVCDLSFPSARSLQGHMNVHYARYVCDKCSARFEADHKLRRHMATVHMEGPFICTICDQAFSKLNTLNAHIWRVHQTLDPYKCPKCEQRFRTFHKRLRHLHDDHGLTEARYPCAYCDKKFYYAGSRSTHVRLTHLQERRHRCEHCPMAFGKRRMLLSHMCTIHNIGEKKHECHKCQKRFYRSVTLRYHMKTHETAEQELHQCPVCYTRFSYKNHLKLHMKSHTNAQKVTPVMEIHRDAHDVTTIMESHRDAQDVTTIMECHRDAQDVTTIMECHRDAQDVTTIMECHRDAQDVTTIMECHRDAHDVTTIMECHRDAHDVTTIMECHRDAHDVTTIMECHRDAQDVTTTMECHTNAQEQTSMTECHNNAQDVTSMTECHENVQKLNSLEDSLIIEEDKLYDVTNDIVYLEIY